MMHNVAPALSFGFGYTAAMAEHHAQAHVAPSAATAASSTSQAPRGLAKRRRSPSVSEVVEDDEAMDASEDIPKRRRASSRSPAHDAATSSPSLGKSPPRVKAHDLGRLLASFEKPALLSILLDLAKDDEHMAERIYTRLPTPSVEHAISTLHQYEARVRAALPTSTTGVRDQYVWSRVRGILSELLSELAWFVPLFSMTPRASHTEPLHPSTTFAFLHAATACMLRIVRTLPQDAAASYRRVHADTLLKTFQQSVAPAPDARDVMAHAIFPMLLREWQAWLSALDAAVNQHARMFGQDAILTWERGLTSLGTQTPSRGASEHAMRAAMDDAVAQLRTSIGWLMRSAHRTPWLAAPSFAACAMDVGDE